MAPASARVAYDRRMRWMRRALVVVGCGVALALPSNAFAQVLAPPGHPGSNQYFETIPTSAGNAAPPGSVSGSGSAAASARRLASFGHGRAGDARLARLGKVGLAAAALAAATAPTSPAAVGQHGGTSGDNGVTGVTGVGQTPTISLPPGQSAASALANALTGTDTGGLGFVLPLLLALGVVAAVGFAALRLRRRSGPPDATA